MAINRANYIYVERRYSDNDKLEVEQKEVSGRYVVKIYQNIKKTQKKFLNLNPKFRKKRDDRKLFKTLRKYANEESVLMADKNLTEYFDIPNVAFEMRKNEMKNHIDEILQFFQIISNGFLERRKFLLVVESDYWSYSEVQNVIWCAKNYYEDIYVIVKETIGNQLKDFFYDEYGVMIHIIEKEDVKNVQVTTIWLLLKEWEDCVWEYSFENGYVVAEWENSMRRQRKKMITLNQRKEISLKKMSEKSLYSGFSYEIRKMKIPYEIAVLIANEAENRHRLKTEGNPISIVAIYSIE